MPKVAATLSLSAIQKRVREARASGKKRTFCLSPGLYLQVRGETASALFRYSRGHGDRARVSVFGLGSFDPWHEYAAGQLERLRVRVMDLQHQRHNGRDPKEERAARRAEKAQAHEAKEMKAAASAATFGKVCDAWLATHESHWSRSHAEQTGWQIEKYLRPVLGNKPVSTITQEDLLAILRPLWGVKHTTAVRLRTILEAVFDFAMADKAYAFTGPNLAVYKGGLKPLLPMEAAPPVRHYTGVPVDDVAHVVSRLLAVGGLRERALVLAILTACRSVNAREARWCEFDFASAVWSISGDRMKNGQPWRSPLPAAALDMLAALKPKDARPEDNVFPSVRGGCIGPNSLRFAMKDIGRTEHPHGFRSVFRSWSAEAGFSHTAAEYQLSHVEGSAVVRAYQRSDLLELRRGLLNQWAALVMGESNVIPMVRSA